MRDGERGASRRPSRARIGPIHRRAATTGRGGGASTSVSAHKKGDARVSLACAPRVVLRTDCKDGARISSFILQSTSTSGSRRRRRSRSCVRRAAHGAVLPVASPAADLALLGTGFGTGSFEGLRPLAERRPRKRCSRDATEVGRARRSSPSFPARSSPVATSPQVRSHSPSSSSARWGRRRSMLRRGSASGPEGRAHGGHSVDGSAPSTMAACFGASALRRADGLLESGPSVPPW